MARKRRDIEYTITDSGCHVCISHKPDGDGYPGTRVNGKTVRLHKVVFLRDVGPIPDGMVIRHTCDVKPCINPEHLILGTHAQNVADRVARGRSAKGTQHGRSKLDGAKAREIRASKESNGVLAKKFGVDPSAIRQIRFNKNWVGA